MKERWRKETISISEALKFPLQLSSHVGDSVLSSSSLLKSRGQAPLKKAKKFYMAAEWCLRKSLLHTQTWNLTSCGKSEPYFTSMMTMDFLIQKGEKPLSILCSTCTGGKRFKRFILVLYSSFKNLLFPRYANATYSTQGVYYVDCRNPTGMSREKKIKEGRDKSLWVLLQLYLARLRV